MFIFICWIKPIALTETFVAFLTYLLFILLPILILLHQIGSVNLKVVKLPVTLNSSYLQGLWFVFVLTCFVTGASGLYPSKYNL